MQRRSSLHCCTNIHVRNRAVAPGLVTSSTSGQREAQIGDECYVNGLHGLVVQSLRTRVMTPHSFLSCAHTGRLCAT